MSVNKFMHPRNIYKTPPNFKQMAIDYPEFRKYVKQEITGKIKIDFKDNETLRSLTKTLLKKDFDLDVEIPLNRLIPTVPLRLNYILWLEDLLSICELNPEEHIHGLDIGTGASCIYPLLAARKNNWKMTATEINIDSLNIAQENINRNNLQHLISIKQSSHECLLNILTDSGATCDFSMCNPPFFASSSDLDPLTRARSDHRPLPRNAPSGALCETVVEGGEVDFISKLIKESVEFSSQIKIFTSMIGHKSSIAPLKVLLRSVEVTSFKQTEFHQGHTTRWGLCWTFHNIDLRKIPQNILQISKKKPKTPKKFIIPKNFQNLNQIIEKTREIFQTLQMTYEEIKKNKFMYAFLVSANENTWSHQRRKRREQIRKNLTADTAPQLINSFIAPDEKEEMDIDTSTESLNSKRSREESDDEEYYNVKKLKINQETIYLKFNCVIRKLSDEFHLEMLFVDGAEKDSLHQVLQYFKNNFK